MNQVLEEGLSLVRKKGIGVLMGGKRIEQTSEVENHEELIAFFNKMGAESVRKSRGRKGWEGRGERVGQRS